MQRGREHGQPGYNTFRKACGLTPLHSWKDVERVLSTQTASKFQFLYEHPDDIDLFVGGIMETHLPGGSVGPTFACIIAEQFHNLRYGDRFWPFFFTRSGNDPELGPGFFLPQQYSMLDVSLARVICDNTDGIELIPRWPLSAQRNLVPCSDLPRMDLGLWKEGTRVRNTLIEWLICDVFRI